MTKVAQIVPALRDELADVLLMTGNDYGTNAKLLHKGVNRDAKFNRWLKSGGEPSIPLLKNNKEDMEKLLDTIQGNFTSIRDKKALVIKMLDANIAEAVAAKDAEVTNGLILSEEQKAAHAIALKNYEKIISTVSKRNLMLLGSELGVIEVVDSVQAAVAQPVAAE